MPPAAPSALATTATVPIQTRLPVRYVRPVKEEEFALAADACIAARKTLAGAHSPIWIRGRDPDEMRLKLPLEIAGELCGAFLVLMAYPEYHSLKFRLCLEFHDKVIDRLDFELDASHANKAGFGDLVHGPHWHAWEDNRHLAGAVTVYDKLPIAVAFTNAQRFDAGLRWYCERRNIELGYHEIEFPPRGRLI